MNKYIMVKTLSTILIFEGIAMIPAIIVGYIYQEFYLIPAFISIAFTSLLLGLALFKILRPFKTTLNNRYGLMLVTISWIVICLIGTLPYYLSGLDYSFVDCLFESISGWTTTGGFVIDPIKLPMAVLMWKATTNWLGGVGILVLTISILPSLGISGLKLASSEITGPEIVKTSARISDTAKTTYLIYIFLTAVEFLLLYLSKMGLFPALINTMTTISTAGIYSTGGEIALGFSPYVKAVITLFTILGSINFIIFFHTYTKQWQKIKKDPELKWYISLIIITSIVMGVAMRLSSLYDDLFSAMGDALVQVVGYVSTSGFSITNVNELPNISQFILLILLLIGGCSGSTAGSLKIIRVMVFIKLIIRGIYKRIHPKAVKPVLINGNIVSAANASSISVYILMYLFVLAIGMFLLSFEDQNLMTTISGAIASLSNNGAGLAEIANGDFNCFSSFGKLVCATLMLFGRLEIYALLIIFSRSFWKPNQAFS